MRTEVLSSMLGWHDAVLACPDDEGGALEVGQAFGRVEHQISVGCDRAEHADGVAADVAPLQGRFHPAGGDGVPSQCQPPEGEGEPAERPEAHLLHEQPEDRG